MDRVKLRQYEMLVRVRDFAAARVNLFPSGSPAGKAFASVAAAVEQLSEHAVDQMSARQQRAARPTARRQLIEALHAIGRTARVIKEADPSFRGQFDPPKPQRSRALIAAGRSFVREATPLADVFIAHELPSTFIADLNALIEALEQTLHARQSSKDARTAAQVQFDSTLDQALGAVRRLDVLVRNRLKDDSSELAVWERDSHIGYPRRKTKDAAAAATASSSNGTPTEDKAA